MIAVPLFWHTTLLEFVWTVACIAGAIYSAGGMAQARADREASHKGTAAARIFARMELRTERLLFWVPAVFGIVGFSACLIDGPHFVTLSGLLLVITLVAGVLIFPFVSYRNRKDRPLLTEALRDGS